MHGTFRLADEPVQVAALFRANLDDGVEGLAVGEVGSLQRKGFVRNPHAVSE